MEPINGNLEALSVHPGRASGVWTVYCHIHHESGRRYVGITSRGWRKRWNQHVSQAKYAKVCRSHWYNAIRTYGKDAFDHEVLETCDTVEAANLAEQKWIAHFDTLNPERGFNLAPGGAHTPHPVRNPFDRPGFREARIADLKRFNESTTPAERSIRTATLWQDPEFRERAVSASKAARATPEAKERFSAVQKAVKARPDVKARASAVSAALWGDPAYRAAHEDLWKDPAFREKCGTGLKHGASMNSAKTHCKAGHPLSGENLYVNKRGSRECRTCCRERGKANTRAGGASRMSASYRSGAT